MHSDLQEAIRAQLAPVKARCGFLRLCVYYGWRSLQCNRNNQQPLVAETRLI